MAYIAPALHSPDNFYSYTFPIFLHWISLCVTSLQRTCFEFIKSLKEWNSFVWQRYRHRDTCFWLHDKKFMVLRLSNPQKYHPSPPNQPFKIILPSPETSPNKSGSLKSWVSFHKQDTKPECNSGYCHRHMGCSANQESFLKYSLAPFFPERGLIFRPGIF